MRAREIVILVAGAALLRSYSAAFRTTTHVHGMRVAVVTLPGKVASRMAIHASRVMQNGQHCLEGSSRCRITLHYPRSWALLLISGSSACSQKAAHNPQRNSKDDRQYNFVAAHLSFLSCYSPHTPSLLPILPLSKRAPAGTNESITPAGR